MKNNLIEKYVFKFPLDKKNPYCRKKVHKNLFLFFPFVFRQIDFSKKDWKFPEVRSNTWNSLEPGCASFSGCASFWGL